MLSAVGVQRPSVNKGKHRVHLAMLHEINVEECVEFLEGVEPGPEFFEKVHNQWDWLEDEPTRPWWKVYVLNGRDVVFVFHHIVCDGLSGMTFHRTFLHALNSLPSELDSSSTVDNIVTFDPSKRKLFPHSTTLSKHRPNIPEAIYIYLLFLFMRLIFGKRMLFATLPPTKPHSTAALTVAPPEQRTITNVSSLRIPSEKVQSILKACRAHRTTFTPLLSTMFLVTFTADIFPNAVVGLSAVAYGIDKYINMPQLEGIERRDGVISNLAGGVQQAHFVGKYRKAMVETPKTGQKEIDTATAWKLVQEYGQMMQEQMPNRAMRCWIGCELVKTDLEDFVAEGLPSLGSLMKMTFGNSNLGVFSADNGEEKGANKAWKVDDFQWSVAATNGTQSSRGFKFSVAGAKGGDTVINMSYEEGIVSREMAEEVLRLTMNKIEAMI